MTSIDLQEVALDIIGIIDYDVEKECINEIEEEGQSTTVNELISYLEVLLDERSK